MMCLPSKELEDSDFVLALHSAFLLAAGFSVHSRTVGGVATPAACSTLWHTPRRSVRRYSFLPCISTSTSCSARRSRLISAHSSLSPCFSSRVSSSFRTTKARKLQNTCPRMVSSNDDRSDGSPADSWPNGISIPPSTAAYTSGPHPRRQTQCWFVAPTCHRSAAHQRAWPRQS